MQKREFLGAAALVAASLVTGRALAQGAKFKIGLILPMTGPFASTGRQIENGVVWFGGGRVLE